MFDGESKGKGQSIVAWFGCNSIYTQTPENRDRRGTSTVRSVISSQSMRSRYKVHSVDTVTVHYKVYIANCTVLVSS